MRLFKIFLVISILQFSPLGGVRGGFCSALLAQNYDSLWKEFEKANEKDQPRSAIAVLQKVRDKAEKERQYGHLLAASFAELSMQREISTDSLVASKARLHSRDSLLFAKDVAAAWVYRIALAVNEGKGKGNIIKELLADAEVKEVFTRKDAALKYVPFVKKGKDGGLFNNDLLSVAASTLEDYELLPAVYLEKGDRKAACMATALHLEKKLNVTYGLEKHQRLLSEIDAAIEKYADLQECGKLAKVKNDILFELSTYEKEEKEMTRERYLFLNEAVKKWSGWKWINELKNSLAEFTSPSYSIRIIDNGTYKDGDQLAVAERIKNISELKITLTPIEGCTEKVLREYSNPSQVSKYLRKNKALNVTHHFDKHEAYETFGDTINLGHIPVGTYLVEIKADGKSLGNAAELLSVTNLQVIALQQSKNTIRYVVVDAQKGHPVPHAKLYVTDDVDDDNTYYTTDDRGEYVYEYTEHPSFVRAVTDTDIAFRRTNLWTSYSSYGRPSGKKTMINIYTDRAIYHPGQTIHVSAIAYDQINGDETKAKEGKQITLTFADANRKQVGEVTAETDEYGVAAVDFTIPEGGKNGSWIIRCDGASQRVRVEEYVRPTYDVSIERPEVSYVNGDTIEVMGVAKAYSGAPVSGAQVVFNVKRNPLWWFRMPMDDIRDLYASICKDTITTSNDGTFIMRVPMVLPHGINNLSDSHGIIQMPLFVNIQIDANVTDIAGESHAASLSLPLGNKASFLSTDLKEKILFDAPISFKVWRRNNAGVEIDGKVDVKIDGKLAGAYDANMAIVLSDKLPSGKHEVEIVCESDTIKQDLVIFRKDDKRPVVDTDMWWYQNNEEKYVQFGTSERDVTVYYTLLSEKKVLENGVVSLDSSLVTRTFDFKDVDGDCISYYVCWVRNGKMYSNSASFQRPLTSQKLNVTWHTFRNKLTPGQQEEWKLTVADEQGEPVKANVMAVLYDKSLDAILPHNWNFYTSRLRGAVSSMWRMTNVWNATWSGSKMINYLKLPYFELSRIDENFLYPYQRPYLTKGKLGSPMLMKSMAANDMAYSAPMATESAAVRRESVAIGYAPTNGDAKDVEASKAPVEEEEMPVVPVRENLNETAFFMPQIRTDNNGVASLSFTLPESVTTWRFLALAHDKDMRNGMIKDEVVAQKKLMVQPRMPRFLREGDKAMIAASVANLSEKALTVKVMMRFTDEETGKVISSQTKKVSVKAGSTEALSFAIDCKALGGKMLICTTTAACRDFSDGEEHRLPVLTDMERVVNTFTFATRDGLSTDSIIKVLTPKGAANVEAKVDKVDHPELMMLDALPTVKNTSDNAISLVSAYYANTITSAYRNQPTDSLKMLMTRLLILQHSDGSWSWWKGMQGSDYVTMYVLKTLLRLNSMVGERRETEQLIRSSLAYLDKEVAKSIAEMKKYTKKNETPYLSTIHEDYLYCLTLLPSSPKIRFSQTAKENKDYLIKYLASNTRKDDMATKAKSAIVLADNGKRKDAAEFMESIRQHTVYREDMGRYFDSYRALQSWCDYRIPTQVAAIEAFKKVLPEDAKTTWDMQRWLLQSKRTQQWDNPVNTVNAVYAFSEGNTMQFSNKGSTQGWTNVFVTFNQNIADIAESSTGLKVKREVSKDNLKVGDRVKVKITIEADRDYDFITVTDQRAACLEPVSQLSGYYTGGCYRELHDTDSKYYFDKFRKGTHVIETEYYVTRTGTYHTGITKAESTYAPEFSGRDKGIVIQVSQAQLDY